MARILTTVLTRFLFSDDDSQRPPWPVPPFGSEDGSDLGLAMISSGTTIFLAMISAIFATRLFREMLRPSGQGQGQGGAQGGDMQGEVGADGAAGWVWVWGLDVAWVVKKPKEHPRTEVLSVDWCLR